MSGYFWNSQSMQNSLTTALASVIERPIEDGRLAELIPSLLADPRELFALARGRRDRSWGRALTFSPKVFLPLTNLCRNRCDYCSFRKSPGDPGEWTMAPSEVESALDQASASGCVEALFCLGDSPETGFGAYRRLLSSWGFASTVDYLEWAGRAALDRGLLPHTNAGILERAAMDRLRRVNVSLGLMLENVSERLCEPDGPHFRAPDKRPAVRLEMTRTAGELKIPFTSGLLIGIGETWKERLDTISAIREIHREYGHIQEVIVQNFRAQSDMVMAAQPEPGELEVAVAVALTRCLLPDEISVQAPPNLNPASVELLIGAGLNDWGGISPLTPDYINREHPWPHLQRLADSCAAEGFELKPRLPVYPKYVEEPGWIEDGLNSHLSNSKPNRFWLSRLKQNRVERLEAQ